MTERLITSGGEQYPALPALDGKLLENELEQRFQRHTGVQEEVTFEFTRDPVLLQQYYELRERIYTQKWGLEHFPDGPDAYDRQGMILVARQGKLVVAGVRMLVRSPRQDRALPVEDDGINLRKLLPELQLEHHTYCEFSKLARLPEYHGTDFSLTFIRMLKRKALAHGVRYAFILAPWAQIRNYRLVNRADKDRYIIRDDIEIPDHEHFEGIRMVLSYLDFSDVIAERKEHLGGVASEGRASPEPEDA